MQMVQCTPLIGLPQFNGWSQVTTTSNQQLICVFAVQGQNASNVGRDLVEKLMPVTVVTAVDLHTLITELLQETHAKGCELQLSAGLFTGEKTIFGVVKGSVVLKRGTRVGSILSSQGELKIIEGRHLAEDSVVLATEQATTFLGEIQQKLTQGFDIDTTITSIVPIVHGVENSSLSALGFVTARTQTAVEPILASNPSSDLLNIELVIGDKSESENFDNEEVEAELVEPTDLEPELAEDQDINQEPEVAMAPTPVVTPTLPVISKPQHLPKLKQKLSANFDSLRTRFKNMRLPSTLPSNFPTQFNQIIHRPNEVYLTQHSTKKVVRMIVPIVIAVVVLTIGVFIYRSRVNQQVEAATLASADMTAAIAQARDTVSSDPIAARERVRVAIGGLEQLEQQYQNQRSSRKYIQEQLVSARQLYEEISGKEEFSELPIFYDLRLVQPNFVASDADAVGTTSLFVDKDTKQLVSVDLDAKQAQMLDVGSLNQINDASLQSRTIWLLGQGLRRSPLNSTGSAEVVKEEGDSNREATLIGSFGQYIYIFNPAKRNIYRYAPQNGGLSDPVGWLRSSQGLDFSLVKSMAIDGDLWLGTEDGQIKKFTTGQTADFEIKGLTEPFTSTVILFTQEDFANVYVLEPAQHRVVILNKNGEFIKEVKSASLATASTLIVSEQLGKIFPISGSIVFEIKI